jgi:hypothetical protein
MRRTVLSLAYVTATPTSSPSLTPYTLIVLIPCVV